MLLDDYMGAAPIERPPFLAIDQYWEKGAIVKMKGGGPFFALLSSILILFS
jgi:hypothetical protein